MKNVPRVFIDSELREGAEGILPPAAVHYLTHVMRTNRFLAFNNGDEYEAELTHNSYFILHNSTGRSDPSGKWEFYFAPIKKIEDLIAGIVQMGARVLQPVITERTVARRVNWPRMKKIIIENAEQSGRNSVPELRPPIPFDALDKKGIVYGDERGVSLRGVKRRSNLDEIAVPCGLAMTTATNHAHELRLLVGPEGGFSDAEFDALGRAGAVGVCLAPTILRAEVAAVALAARVIGGE